VLVVGSVLTVGRRPRLEVSRQVEPRRVQKGSTAVAVVYVRNLALRSQPPLSLEQRLGDTPVRVTIPRMRRLGEYAGTYRLPTDRRGDFELGPIEVVRADPFGLCRRVQTLGESERIAIHPRIVELSRPPAGRSRNLEGPSSDTSPQGSVTFHRIREYAAGDDLRRVHWPSTARRGQLMVRHMVDTAQAFTVVLFDQRPALYSPDTFEEAVDVAASAAHAMSGGTAPVQLRTTGGIRIGGPHQRDPLPIVDHLTSLGPDETGSLTEQASLLGRDRGGSVLVVVTGRLETETLPTLVRLRRRFDRLLLASIVAHPQAAPHFAGIHILVGSTADEIAQSWRSEAVGW
jgi:uncharacterized protein (DUF58 family)